MEMRNLDTLVLVTPRLTLRPFSLDDAPEVQCLAGDREVSDAAVNIPHPYEDGMAERWIRGNLERLVRGEEINCAVTRNGVLVGAVSLVHISAWHRRADLGYWLGRPFWGHGYATEAAGALVDYAFGCLSLHRVQAWHLVRNSASGRVMEKLGMHTEGFHRGFVRRGDVFEDVVSRAILEEEWQPALLE